MQAGYTLNQSGGINTVNNNFHVAPGRMVFTPEIGAALLDLIPPGGPIGMGN